MSQKEEPQETGPKTPPPQRVRQPNSTSVEGGRPRWRPCQLNSLKEQGNAHHHHYHRQSHQQQPGTNQALPRRSRRHTPCHAQRGSSESGDAEAQLSQHPRPGGSRYQRTGNGEHQRRHRQQHRLTHAAPEPQDVPEINPVIDTLSSEESSQELLTPSSQDDLTPFQEEPTPSPQEVLLVENQDGSLHCSSSTESSFHAHSEQTEDHHREMRQTEECKRGIDEWEMEKREVGAETHKEDEQEEQSQVEKDSVANAGGSKDGKKTSRRSGPIRVDVPPFTEFPRQPPTIPNFQSQPFSEPLRGYSIEPKSGSVYLPSTSSDMRPECRSSSQSYEETFSDSNSKACSVSYPPVSESCPKFYPVTPAELGRKLYHSPQTGWYQELSEVQQSFEVTRDMTLSEANPQISLHEKPRPQGSVGSRLHHYNEQSGDEASSPDRGRSKVWRCSVEQECLEIRKEQCEVRPHLPVLDREEKPQRDSAEDRSHALQESVNVSGDAISLAIRDIKEAIEEVKTKAVRSPYMPDKPKEPVWVMRRDVSPVEESRPQHYSPPQLPSPQNMVSV